MSYENRATQVVTEFDYRQSLHMECGVLALEPPPSYTTAMNNPTDHQAQGGSTENEEEKRVSVNYRAALQLSAKNNRGSPPPYDGNRDRACRSRGTTEGHRNSEIIQLTDISDDSKFESDDAAISNV